MVANTIPAITALEAEAEASLFLSDNLPDRLTAGNPRLNKEASLWLVPVLLTYPVIGTIGQVGEIAVSTQSGEVISHTPVNEMLSKSRALYDQHHDAIEAPVS